MISNWQIIFNYKKLETSDKIVIIKKKIIKKLFTVKFENLFIFTKLKLF